MTDKKSKINASDITIDSEILGMDICSDSEDNWFIRIQEGYYMTEDGNVVEIDSDNNIPREAVIDNIVKSQQLVQEYHEDIDLSDKKYNSNESSDIKKNIGESTELDSEDTKIDEKAEELNDVKSKEDESKEDESKEDESKEDESKEDESKEDESKEDLIEQEFGVDKMEDNRPESTNEDSGLMDKLDFRSDNSEDEKPRSNLSDNIDEYDEESQSFIENIKSYVSNNEEAKTEKEKKKDNSEDSSEGIITSVKSVFDDSDDEKEPIESTDSSVDHKDNKEKSEIDNTKSKNEEDRNVNSEIQDNKENVQDQEEKKKDNSEDSSEGIITSVKSVFDDSDDEKESIESTDSSVDHKDNKENHQQGSELSIPLLVLLSVLIPPAAYYYIGRTKLGIINLFSVNFIGLGLFIVPIHTYSIINNTDEIDEELSEEEIKDDTDEIDEELSEEEIKDDTDEIDISIYEQFVQFLSSDIAELNQKRPDAQNVSINYINTSDDGIEWSDTIKSFWSKLRKSKSGDEIAQKDLSNDVWTRYFALIKRNSYARGDLIDLIFTTILSLIGVLLIFTGIISILTGRVGSLEALTQPSGYADQIVITASLLGVVSISMWLSRRIATKTIVSAIRRPIRISAVTLLLLQFAVMAIIVYTITLGGGQEGLRSLELTLDSYIEPIIASIPVESVSEFIMEAYEKIRGPETSLFGVNIIESSVFMSLIGAITAYPVLKRSVARLILTTNMDPREFREETGILVEQLSDAEKEYDGPKYVMGGGGTVQSDSSDSRTVTSEDELVKIDSDEEREGLLALPDHIKGSPFADYEEVRRYWVRPPYAYVSIVYNERQNDYRYVVVEPELDESEKAIFDELKERLDTVLLLEDVEEKEDYEKEVEMKLEKLETRMIELSQEYNIDINDETFHRLMYFVEREYVYYNKIDPLINDPNVEDISCDGEDKYIFVFHSDYKDIITNVKFQKEELRSFIQELAQRSGEHISAADPMVDASLPDGSRAQMTLGSEVTTKGSTFTIRLFEDIPFTPVDLLGYDTFSLTQMAYLWTAIEHNKSLIFAGGTASGKTTSMNAVSMFIPPKAKVITIEDTREISLPQENWIPGTTREGVGGEEGGDDIDMYELLRAALRQRPEYIVVGEIRGKEAETLFQAMNTGHTTYSTMHAETVDAAIGRLTNPPINVPKQMITALDIICIQNQIRFTDDNGDVQNVRRNEETREIVGLRDNGQFQNRRPFQWDAETDTFIQSLEDSYVLSRISEENGWTPEDKQRELQEREEVLEYMVEEDIREFEYVSNIIQAYMVDSDKIVREVRNDTLEPSDLKSLTDMEWDEPDKTLSDMSGSDMPQIEGDSQ